MRNKPTRPRLRIDPVPAVAASIAASVVIGLMFPTWGIPFTDLAGGGWLVGSVIRHRPTLVGLSNRRAATPKPGVDRARATKALTVATMTWGIVLIVQFGVLSALALTLVPSDYNTYTNIIVAITYIVGVPITIVAVRRYALRMVPHVP